MYQAIAKAQRDLMSVDQQLGLETRCARCAARAELVEVGVSIRIGQHWQDFYEERRKICRHCYLEIQDILTLACAQISAKFDAAKIREKTDAATPPAKDSVACKPWWNDPSELHV